MSLIKSKTAGASPLIGVDTGGTFTDVVMLNPSNGELRLGKTASTPDDPSLGFRNGVADMLDQSGHPGSGIGRVLHATTVATNLILERKGPQTAVIVTNGFKYILEIARHSIAKRANMYTWIKPPRTVTPPFIWEVPGRVDYRGREFEALDEEAVRKAAKEIVAAGITTVAVNLLHSYANPKHEQRIRDILKEESPTILVSLSSEVLPVYREYERCVATLLNAYVSPIMSSYVQRLEERMQSCDIRAPLMLMKSSGGMTSTRIAQRKPVETALSGPAAGAVGAAFIGRMAGFDDLITIDIGGTSADISLIQGGTPHISNTGAIGDWRLGLPIVDIMTIGAGGGSIARVTDDGDLMVGPHSAGAKPGPVCYGNGGTEPTVTDAHLVVGQLLPELLGGSFRLDYGKARDAIQRRIADPLGLDVTKAARGILEVIDNNMVGTLRVVSVERGFDPRDFVLMPFGGAGPLHGCTLMRLLGCRTMLIPPAPGVLSALGLVVSNLRAEFSRTCVQRWGHYDIAELAQVFKDLGAEAMSWFEDESVPKGSRQMTLQASLRYKDQGFELDVPWSGSAVNQTTVNAVVNGFHEVHQRMYGFALRDAPVEIVNVRVNAVGLMPTAKFKPLPKKGPASGAKVGVQQLLLPKGMVKAPVYDRSKLGAGAVIEGPAVITQMDATSVLLSGQRAKMHEYGSLVVQDETI